MENFLKKPPPSNETGEEGGRERSPRFSENLPGPLIYQPRPSRTRSESFSNHARRLTQGRKAPNTRFPFVVKNDDMREASGFVARQTREFVDDGGSKKNLAHRGTRSLPILTTVVVLCKLDVEWRQRRQRRQRRWRFASPKNLPDRWKISIPNR